MLGTVCSAVEHRIWRRDSMLFLQATALLRYTLGRVSCSSLCEATNSSILARATVGTEKELDTSFADWLADNPPPGQLQAAKPPISSAEAIEGVTRTERFHWRYAAHLLRLELGRSDVSWDALHRAFVCKRNSGNSTALLQMPRILAPPREETAADLYLQAISNAKGKTVLDNTLMVLLSADSAALGLWEGDVLRKHKVNTAYTVRKQHGASQAKYLRSCGPGRSVGGQLRAREAKRLFDDTATRLDTWKTEIAGCNQAFMSGDVRVWNALYEATPELPISRHDSRWQRASLSVRRPRLQDIRRLFKHLSYGALHIMQSAG